MTAYAISLRRNFVSVTARTGARGGEIGTRGGGGKIFLKKCLRVSNRGQGTRSFWPESGL